LSTSQTEYLTLGKCALALGVQEWQLRRLADAGRVPFTAAGSYRLFASRDLPAIRSALRAANYLPQTNRAATA
jgi:hypothetical protein